MANVNINWKRFNYKKVAIICACVFTFGLIYSYLLFPTLLKVMIAKVSALQCIWKYIFKKILCLILMFRRLHWSQDQSCEICMWRLRLHLTSKFTCLTFLIAKRWQMAASQNYKRSVHIGLSKFKRSIYKQMRRVFFSCKYAIFLYMLRKVNF